MEILNKPNENGGTFVLEKEGRKLAMLQYSLHNPQLMVIEHTEVSDELRGQHIGQKLVAAAVAYAIEKQIKIRPVCPFANAIMNKNQEFQALISTT
ncbi:MAG TPA: GNAT family N-acetyltransferase [Chitinophagaceae bacterium]|nr:GNAT family N-acetyltransferase [Chitinophagaceae bacterium]